MIIKKYASVPVLRESTQIRLEHYRMQASGFLSVKRDHSALDKMRSGLMTILPLAAASLSPFVLKAQCDVPGSGQNSVCPLPNTTKVDLDGGGYDLLFQLPTRGFRASSLVGTNMQFAHYNVGPFAYFIGYVSGASIDAGSGNFGTVPATSFINCSVTAESYAYLDYEATGRGDWDGLVNQTRFLGVIKNNRVGWVEVTYNDNTNTYSIGDFGLASESIATLPVVPAGDCAVLPVSLVFFKAETIDNDIMLFWQTEAEINNEGFEIQRSTDGIKFGKIGWMEGAGNTTETIDYTFEDRDVDANTTYYYRLKQVDFDGKFEFSPTVSITYNLEGQTSIQDFAPNPIREDFTYLRIDSGRRQQATVEVFDAVGRRIFQKQTELIHGLHSVLLDLSRATSGTYFVHLQLEDGTSLFKKLSVVR